MGYQAALRYLKSLYPFGIQLGLERARKLLSLLGHPEQAFPVILVAGTNGKGSVVAMLARILEAAGYRVGQYTSPHLVDYRERISINRELIPLDTFATLTQRIKRAVRRLQRSAPHFVITPFELMTMIACCYFSRERVDIAVVEVGLGGRLDTTNLLSPLGVVITNVEYDHMDYLGKHLSAIAKEKAGVMRKGIPIVTASTRPVVLEVLKQEAKKRGAVLLHTSKQMAETSPYTFLAQSALARQMRLWVSDGKHHYGWLQLAFRAPYQIPNVLCVLRLLEQLPQLKVSRRALREGLAQVVWPGRFQILLRNPLVIMDVAHNPAGAASLAATLAYYERRAAFVVAVQKTKDVKGIVKALAPQAEAFIATELPQRPSHAPRLISKAAQAAHVASVETSSLYRALRMALASFSTICITGSLYAYREVQEVLRELGYLKSL